MGEVMERIKKCEEYIRSVTDFNPLIGIVLGSGLGGLAGKVEKSFAIDYEDIPGFPKSTVEGHEGRFIFGYFEDIPVVVMQGRVHFYEGYSMDEVVLPIRLMGRLGIKTLFLSNAAGGLGKGFKAGDLMLITDQISTFVRNPLIGQNENELGVRFPDMSEIYNKQICDIIRDEAKSQGIDLKEGVYIQFTGPSYETPAEIKMAGLLGASAVGMSTTVEAIAAKHMGLNVCGISLITNMAAGMNPVPLSHEEVKQAADEAGPKFQSLVKSAVVKIGRM